MQLTERDTQEPKLDLMGLFNEIMSNLQSVVGPGEDTVEQVDERLDELTMLVHTDEGDFYIIVQEVP